MNIKSEWQAQASLKRFNSWRIGGCAEWLFIPKTVTAWQQALQAAGSLDVTVMGLGSNILLRDGGLPGLVVVTQRGLSELTLISPTMVRAEAGAACGTLARFAARHGLAGAEFFAGIPGTVGGALRMNAGCFGGDTWSRVVSVNTLNRQGELQHRMAEEYTARYREVVLPADEWFVSADFLFVPDEVKAVQARIRQLVTKRQQTQPNAPSCGSVFKNPSNGYAAALIEACGLKGKRIGDAVVSPLHANFIINEGQASAHDIETLMIEIQHTVQDKTGTFLQPEVKIMGEN